MREYTLEEVKEAVRLIVRTEAEDEKNTYHGEGQYYMLWLMSQFYECGFVLVEK